MAATPPTIQPPTLRTKFVDASGGLMGTSLQFLQQVWLAIKTAFETLAPIHSPTFTGTITGADASLSGNLAVAGTLSVATTLPIIILATGQSNFVYQRAFSWAPASNAKLWNWNGTTGTVGTAFAALDHTLMQVTWKFASDVAKNNLGRAVYLINIGQGGMSITHWMSGTGSPDIYADIEANVSAALAAISVSKIDMLLWWQGEADIPTPATWLTDFETVITRFKGETWFPINTPVMLFGIAPGSLGVGSTADRMNTYIQAAANSDPDFRRYVPSGALPATGTYWIDSVHATAVGYDLLGTVAANEFLNGSFRGKYPGVVVDDISGKIGVNAVPLATATPARYTISNNALNKTFASPPSGTALHLLGADGASVYAVQDAFGGTSNIALRASRGTIDAPTASQSGDLLGAYYVRGFGATGWATIGASFAVFAAQNFTDTAWGSAANIYTIPNNSTTPTLALSIDQDQSASFVSTTKPFTDDGAALGSTTKRWSDLFLAEGGVINWDNGDVTITQTNNILSFAGATTRYEFDATVAPASNDGASLGTSALQFSDAFLAEGGVINWDNGDVTITQTGNVLSFAGATTRYEFDANLTPSTSDGAALGTTALMWSDAYFALGAILNFNNGDYTVTHSTGRLTYSGASTFTGSVTLSAALIYGGVTLSNAVTGTGNMVLSASPTLTGTLTAAAANFSGAITGTAGNTFLGTGGTGTTPTQLFLEGSSGAAGGASIIFRANSVLKMALAAESAITGAGTSQDFVIYSAAVGTAVKVFQATGGVTVGAPTGGDKGTGTLNATAVYDDNVLLTCPALASEFIEKGEIDLAFWDTIVPDREIPEVRRKAPASIEQRPVLEPSDKDEFEHVPQDDGSLVRRKTGRKLMRQAVDLVPIYDEAGNGVDVHEQPIFEEVTIPEVDELVHPARIEKRRHEVAHLFAAMVGEGFDPRDPVAYIAKLKKDQALPGMPMRETWQHASHSVGEIHNRLWLATEMLALAFIGVVDRVAKLEAKQ